MDREFQHRFYPPEASRFAGPAKLTVEETAYHWVDPEDLPAHPEGRLFRFRRSRGDDWVRNRHGAMPFTKSPDTPNRNSGDGSVNG